MNSEVPWAQLTPSFVLFVSAGGFSLDASGSSVVLNDAYQWYDAATGWSSNVATSSTRAFSPRYGHRCIEFGDSIVMVGGMNATGHLLSDVWVTSDLGATWDSQAALPYALAYPGLIVSGGTIWLLAVRDTNIEVEIWTTSDVSSSSWTRVFFSSVAPGSRGHAVWELLDDTMYLIGGASTGGTGLSDVWKFDPNTNVWSPLSAIPAGDPNTYCGHTVYQGQIVLVGGESSDLLSETDTILTFDGSSWSRFSQSPLFTLASPAVVSFRNSLLVMGGDRSFTSVYNSIYTSNDEYATAAVAASTGAQSGSSLVDATDTGGGGGESTAGTAETVPPSPVVISSTAAAVVSSTAGFDTSSSGAEHHSSTDTSLIIYIVVPIGTVLLLGIVGFCACRRRRGGPPPPRRTPDEEMGDQISRRAATAVDRRRDDRAIGMYGQPLSRREAQEQMPLTAGQPLKVAYENTAVPPAATRQPIPPPPSSAIQLQPQAVQPQKKPQAPSRLQSHPSHSQPQSLAQPASTVTPAAPVAPTAQRSASAIPAPSAPSQSSISKPVAPVPTHVPAMVSQPTGPSVSKALEVAPVAAAAPVQKKPDDAPTGPVSNSSKFFNYDVTLLNPQQASGGGAVAAAAGGIVGAAAASAAASSQDRDAQPVEITASPVSMEPGFVAGASLPASYSYDLSMRTGLGNDGALTKRADAVDEAATEPVLVTGPPQGEEDESYMYRYDDTLSSTRSLRKQQNSGDISMPWPASSVSSSDPGNSASSRWSRGSISSFASGASTASSTVMDSATSSAVGTPYTSASSTPADTPRAIAPGGPGGSRLLPTASFNRVLRSFDIGREEVTLRRPVGRGGFGTVWLAEYRGVDAAVKMIDVDGAGDFMSSFERELSSMCSVHNNRLIQVYGACRDPKQPFICMEWMERGSLHDCLHGSQMNKTAPMVLTPERKLAIAIQLLEGVTYMHNCKPPMLHTDIKSHNVLLDHSMNAKVADFGFAQMLAHANSSSLTSIRDSARTGDSQGIGGTLAYMPPESLGEDVVPPDTKLDMYAIGVVLWELFSGEIPWSKLTFAQILCQVGLYKKTLPPSSKIPPSIQTIITQLFAERRQRPSAKVVLQQLRDINPDSLHGYGQINEAAQASIASTYA